MIIICQTCNKSYEYIGGRKGKRNGHSKTNCSVCLLKRRRNTQKIKALLYKGGKCVSCGYNKSIAALDFHHLDKTSKTVSISEMRGMTWDKIKAELDKTIILCANCHREIEHGVVSIMEIT